MLQSMPTHEVERPQGDSNAYQLYEELLSSEFQNFDDLTSLSSLEHVEAAFSSLLDQQLVPGVLIPAEPRSQSMASHKVTRPHDDLLFSWREKQLLSELQNFDDDLSWLSTFEHDDQPHPSPPEPLFLPQAQSSLKKHSEIQHHAHGSKDYSRRGAHNQIESHPPFDNHKDRQGKCGKIEHYMNL